LQHLTTHLECGNELWLAERRRLVVSILHNGFSAPRQRHRT
jgi:hypothetical protein